MGVSVKKKNKKKHILYEILMNNQGAACLCCDLVQLATTGYNLAPAHAFSLSGFRFGSSQLRDEEALEIERSKTPEIQDCEDENSRKFIEAAAELPLGWPLLHTQIHKITIKEQESKKLGCLQVSEVESADDNRNLEVENYGFLCESEEEVSSSSLSSQVKRLQELGWPLRIILCPISLDQLGEYEAEDRSTTTQQSKTCPDINRVENSMEIEISCLEGNIVKAASRKLLKNLELSCEFNYQWFSYEELKEATSQFSSENLIGEGGYSNVYKGCLPNGKPVAVKFLKSYKEAWNDFSLEVDIVFSLNHKHITALIGVCVEDNHLFLVYDFLPKGSLEEILHGHWENFVLPWEVRFKVAVAIAEALNYLHNECSTPVIHRDVKASNILLSDDFEPQLSDFGLAIWGSTDSTYTIHSDVVGTFGYIAPEYFMHGRVSDKIDVYSFGVVLLELLSGRKPIASNNRSGHKSLVKWAKKLLENGNLKSLLDPYLDNGKEDVEMHRMAQAANLCTNQSPRLRPKMSQILKLLRGEIDESKLQGCANVNDSGESYDWEDDDIFPEVVDKPQLDFSFLDKHDDGSSLSLRGTKRSSRLKLKDYLKEPLD